VVEVQDGPGLGRDDGVAAEGELLLVFPTFLLPAVLRWVTGNAAERAQTMPERDTVRA